MKNQKFYRYIILSIIMLFILLLALIVLSFKWQKSNNKKDISEADRQIEMEDKPVQNNNIIISDDQTNQSGEMLRLGITKENLENIIKESNIRLINEIDRGGSYDIWYEDFRCDINSDNILYNVYVYDEGNRYQSTLGLKIGDSLEKLFQLYGNKYTTYEEGEDEIITIYEYKYVNNIFYVAVDGNEEVVGWGVESLVVSND